MDAATWDERYAAAEVVWSVEPNQFVAGECADLTPGHALDLAAGEGRNALWLASLGWQVTAVDFSRVGLDKGRAAAPEASIEWVCADVLDWQPRRSYDLVVLAYLQLVAEERRAVVRQAYDALRPGGTLLLVAHDSTNLAHGAGGPQDASVLMTAEDVLADLDGLDLSVVTAERVAREVRTVGSHVGAMTAYDCLVRVVRE